MPSPRATYLEAVADCLRCISKDNGYRTDAGALVTREPAPKAGEDRAPFVTVVFARQARGATPATVGTKRLTTVEIVAKLPATVSDAQQQIDDILSDIEDALANQQYRFPTGYEFPQYQTAEPLPEGATAGWVGVVVTTTGHIPIR